MIVILEDSARYKDIGSKDGHGSQRLLSVTVVVKHRFIKNGTCRVFEEEPWPGRGSEKRTFEEQICWLMMTTISMVFLAVWGHYSWEGIRGSAHTVWIFSLHNLEISVLCLYCRNWYWHTFSLTILTLPQSDGDYYENSQVNIEQWFSNKVCKDHLRELKMTSDIPSQ